MQATSVQYRYCGLRGGQAAPSQPGGLGPSLLGLDLADSNPQGLHEGLMLLLTMTTHMLAGGCEQQPAAGVRPGKTNILPYLPYFRNTLTRMGIHVQG